MSANGTRCRFELVVTETKGPFTDLGETICELPDEPAVPMASRAR